MLTIIPTNPTDLLAYLEWAEVDPNRAQDTRRVLRDERVFLLAAVRGGDSGKIASARDEAVRVCKMWQSL